MPEEKITFEAALEHLENIVKQLEKDELSLEQALEAFEKGIRLSRFCSRCLDEAEKRIEQLTMSDDGRPELKPWEKEEDEDL